MTVTNHKTKVGLVLGGGGARGFFHVGVIKGLQKLKIKVTEIAGTSIGSVIGAMWAANPDADIENAIKDVDLREIIRFIAWESKSKNPENVKKYIKRFVHADTFEELKIKLKISATDINNREEIIFDKGGLFPGLIASISIPGIFRPVEYGKSYLVDGGVINNVPVTLIDTASTLVVSDITGPLRKIDNKSQRIDVLYSSLILLQKELSQEKMKYLNDKNITYLNLQDDKISILDFRKQNFQRLIDLGYKAVMVNSAEIIKNSRQG